MKICEKTDTCGRWLAVRGKISKRGYGVGETCPASTTSTPRIAQKALKNNHLKR